MLLSGPDEGIGRRAASRPVPGAATMSMNRAPGSARSRPEGSGFTLIESLVALALITLALFLGTKLILMEPRILERVEAGEGAIRALEASLETLRSGDLPLRRGILLPPAAYPLGLAAPGLVLRLEEVEEIDPEETPGLFRITVEARYLAGRDVRRHRIQTLVWRP